MGAADSRVRRALPTHEELPNNNELGWWKSFRKDVSALFESWDVAGHYALFFADVGAEEVVFECEVLVARRHLGNVDEREASGVVFEDRRPDQALFEDGDVHLGSELLKEDAHGKHFTHSHAERHILGSGRAEGDVGLELAGPDNRTTEEGEDKARSGFDGDRVLFIFISVEPSKVGVHPTVKTFLKVGLEADTFVAGADQITDNALDGLAMGMSGIMAEAGDLVDGELNVRTSVRGHIE